MDLAGNAAECSVSVEVVDVERPVITCPRFPYLVLFSSTAPGAGSGTSSVAITYVAFVSHGLPYHSQFLFHGVVCWIGCLLHVSNPHDHSQSAFLYATQK